ncbi:MAG: diacylglycerol kinase family lipid kinase [Candidatus Krumholzibacteria bacterium]|jgi:YegS/Rv2252/BmrU family lipid kinase|nr:diacylglycerol kinase family lipid kinase [Candidatus Krumholzibacteria bacterium]
MRDTLFIANPVAGRGLGEKRSRELRKLLSSQDLDYELHMTTAPGDARRVAEAEAANYSRIVALGGDGTIQEVANGLVRARMDAATPHPSPFASLGILPAGTGNDLVKALGIPRKLEQSLERLLQAKEKPLDIGRLRYRIADDTVERERIFTNNMGLGFEGQIVRVAEAIRLPLRGQALYGYALVKMLPRLCRPQMTLTFSDEKIEGEFLLLSVGNGHSCGGGFLLTPDASPHDGQLDFCLLDAQTPARVLRFLPKAMKGKHIDVEGVRMRRAPSLQVDIPEGTFAHADGELLSERCTRMNIEILPGFLPVLV